MKERKYRYKQEKSTSYQELEHQYQLLSDFMNRIPDVIYFKDVKGRLIMVNQAHAKGLGLKPEEVIGKTDFDLFPKERAAMMVKDDMYVMKTGKPIIDKIERATRPDGVDNYVSTTKIPRFNRKGQIVGLMGITRDITHRMQLEHIKGEKERAEKKLAILKEIDRMKSEFVAVLSHELRTPLAISKEASIQLLERMAGPINPKQRKLLTMTKDNMERLNHMIDNLLDMTRIEKRRLRLHYSLANLNDLIMNTADFFRKLAREKDIHLRYIMPKEKINIFIDAERINQVISNLLNNAIKFTEQNGEITVEVKILENKVRVGVIDTGMGIDKRDLSKLFNRFAQVSVMAGVAGKGLGLGLSISKELIEKHGGEIWVESTSGVGSKFYFVLPRLYNIKMLDKRNRDKINHLLGKSTAVYLINVSIINFSEFKRMVRLRARKLCQDLKSIINAGLKEFSWPDREKPPIILQDYEYGTCSIIFSEVAENEAAKLCDLLKEKIRHYFLKHKTENVFINLGILSYPSHEALSTTLQLLANIYVKKIYIGSEIRRFKRVNYKANVEIIVPEKKTELSQTVDISTAGICFITKTTLETDAEIKVGLRLEKAKKPLYLTGRVAWKKDIEEGPKGRVNKYKIGLAFTDLKEKRKELLRLLGPLLH